MPCSMYVAGRNTVVLNVIPARPGCISLMAASVCRVTSSVLAPGSLLDHEHQAGAARRERVADQRRMILDHRRDIAESHLACPRA